MNKKNGLVWKYIGSAAVDSGTLMIGDPCYFVGSGSAAEHTYKDWGGFLNKTKMCSVPQLKFESNTAGLGVVASTAHGDGFYPVYGLFAEGSDRPVAMMVATGDIKRGELPDLPEEG